MENILLHTVHMGTVHGHQLRVGPTSMRVRMHSSHANCVQEIIFHTYMCINRLHVRVLLFQKTKKKRFYKALMDASRVANGALQGQNHIGPGPRSIPK